MSRNGIWKPFLTALLAAALAGPAAGQLELISRAPARFAPDTGDGDFGSVALSDDGRYAAFSSAAANLVPGQQDSNRRNDVFFYDRLAGTTILVSHAAGSSTLAAQGESGQPALSGDGRFVAFVSSAWDLVPGVGDPRGYIDHLYLWSRETGEITAVTRRAGTEEETGHSDSRNPVLSRDGSYLAFLSQASDLIPGQVQGFLDENVFLYERETGDLRLVSHSAASASRCGNGNSGFWSGLSADGRFVAYWSQATDLVTGQSDANQNADVFLYDRLTDASVLVSHAAGSALTTSNGFSLGSSLSADGQFVVFGSYGTDLVSGVHENQEDQDAFLYDRLTGTVTLLSLLEASAGFQEGGWAPRISRDGRTVVFVAGDGYSLIALDPLTGVRTRLAPSYGNFSLSDDGRWVVFENTDDHQVPSQVDDNRDMDVFLHDRATGITTLVSHAAGDSGKAGDQRSTQPVLSADGQWLAYASLATDLVSGVRHGARSLDLLLYETATSVNRVVTVHAPAMASLTAPGRADEASVSAKGRYVVFTDHSDHLFPSQVDHNQKSDVFLHDRVTRKTTLVSRSAASAVTAGNAESSSPRISRDGAWIAFQSRATDLVPGQRDSAGSFDVFLYERQTGAVTLVSRSHISPLRTGRGDSSLSGVSADGSVVVFDSLATDLVHRQRDALATQDVFVFNRRTGAVTLVSRAPSSRDIRTGNDSSFFSSMSPDGAFITFTSHANNLIPGVRDSNSETDAFLWESRTGNITLLSRTRGLSGQASRGKTPLVSAHGRWVAFLDYNHPSFLSLNSHPSLEILDRTTGTVREIAPPGDVHWLCGMSDDGRWILWTSHWLGHQAPALLLFDRLSGESRLVAPEPDFSARLSADGRWVAFTSDAQELVPGQRFPWHNVFLYDRITDEVTLVSRSLFHPTYGGNSVSLLSGISASGHVVFTSAASDLVPRDFNGGPDVFLYSPGEQP